MVFAESQTCQKGGGRNACAGPGVTDGRIGGGDWFALIFFCILPHGDRPLQP